MTAPLPHELLADPRAENLGGSRESGLRPAGTAGGANGRGAGNGNGRRHPLMEGMEAMADGIADAVDRLRARPLLGRRGRSNARSSSRGRPSQRRSGSPDRSRSRSVDGWGRSLSPARNHGRSVSPSRDAERQEERKHKLFSSYARYAAAGAPANERGQGRREPDEGPGNIGGRPRKWRGLQVFAVGPYEDVEAGRRGPERPTSKIGSGKMRGKNGTSGQPELHPFVLPPTHQLAPRIDAWLGFAVASCAAVASIGQLHATSGDSASGEGWQFSSRDKFALAVCAMSFVVSFFVAGGMRYAPARAFLTQPRFTLGPRPLSQLNLTHELSLLSLLLIFWTAALPIVVNGNAYYSASGSGQGAGVPLGVAGSSVWNANLFCSAWACYLLTVYLCVELVTLDDRRGTVKIAARSSHSSSGRRGRAANAFAKRWTLLSVAALILLSASIGAYTGPACSGRLLKETAYCSRALWGVVVGGLLQVLVGLGVAALYRLSAVPSRSHSHSRSRSRAQPVLSVAKRNQLCALSSLASLVLQSATAGMLTSPAGGGPGTSSGTLYFASWLGFGLAFELGLRYLELYSTDFGASFSHERSSSGSRGLRSELVDKETVYEDESESESEESESEEEVLVLWNGSEAGSQRLSLEGEDTDARSFVFERGERVRAPPSGPRRTDSPTAPVPRSGALEPEALRHSHRAGSGGTGSSGTDPLAGSIDAKSALKSSDEFEDTPRDAYAGFHSGQVEALDDVGVHRRDPSGLAVEEPRFERKFSPLQEGSGESSSRKPGSGSGAPRRRVGDNLKHVRAARRPGPKKLEGSAKGSKTSGQAGKSTAASNLRASGSNPPPTVSDKSDGTSSSAPSTVDAPSTQSGSGQQITRTIRPRSVVGPPPYGRSRPRDDPSQHSTSAPLRSIRTKTGNNCESSDSIVSDPTLDAGLDDPPPAAKPKPRARSSSSGRAKRTSARRTSRSRSRGKGDAPRSASSYQNQESDETPETQRIPSSGSDENPSSQEAGAGDDRVDTIVAAALAYAERTHGATSDRSAGRRRGGTMVSTRSSPDPASWRDRSAGRRRGGTSGGSLDSAGTGEFSGREGGTHFDC